MKNLASAAMLITMADKRKPKEAPESQVDKEQVNKRSEDPSDEKDLQELFSWESAARPFKKRDRRFYINLGLMLFIIGLIALFLKEFFLVAVLLAIFFYYYVAGTVEPIRVEHRITNRGIKTAEHEYSYKDLTDFWFGKKYGDNILHVSTKLR